MAFRLPKPKFPRPGNETVTPNLSHVSLQDCLVMPCLGRPFLPGMLYNARKHTIGPQLWNSKRLEEGIVRTEYPEQSHELLTDDSTSDKMSHLDVGASLSVSLLSGLVTISGSARYTQDTKSSKQHSRVSLKYKSTTFCEDFPLDELRPLPQQFPDIFQTPSQSQDDSNPTHIVIRVVYGSQVFMVFDAMSVEGENHMKIQGKLQAQLHLGIPMIQGGSAEVDADVSEDDKEFCKRISMKFYGDGIELVNNPTTYDEAMNVYQNLPSMSGEKGAPQKVWLYPLSNLVPSAPKVVHELGLNHAGKIHQLVDDIHDLTIRSDDILNKMYIKSLHDQQVRFQKWLFSKRSHLMNELAVNLPKAQNGDPCVEEFLDKFCKSFHYDLLSSWMKEKEEEMKALLAFIGVLQGAKVQAAFKDGDLLSQYASSKRLLYLEFNVNRQDTFLESLLKADPETESESEVGADLFEKMPWYRDVHKIKEMKNVVDRFVSISHFMDYATFVMTTSDTCNAEIKAASVSNAVAIMREFGVEKELTVGKFLV